MVLRAMQKWPNVPDVYGWLRMDARGNWLLRTAPGRFERIGNQGLVDFIGRNYGRDARGCWFFQNGPQRVFVGLDHVPFVLHLGEERHWMNQAGIPAGAVRAVLFDEEDRVLLDAECGPGLVIDRDLPALLDGLGDNAGRAGVETIVDDLLMALAEPGSRRELTLFGQRLTGERVRSSDLPSRFGFVPEPQSDSTEQDAG